MTADQLREPDRVIVRLSPHARLQWDVEAVAAPYEQRCPRDQHGMVVGPLFEDDAVASRCVVLVRWATEQPGAWIWWHHDPAELEIVEL